MLKRPHKSIALRRLRPVPAWAVAIAFGLAFPSLSTSRSDVVARPVEPASAATDPVVEAEPEAPNPVESLAAALARCRTALTEEERWKIAGAIHREGEHYGYDPYFVLAMIQVESMCSPTARGFNGGLGLIQIKPETAREVARDAGLPWRGDRSLTAPIVNVRLGLRYLADLEKRFRDPYLAIVAYNRGPGRIGKMSSGQARRAQYVRKILARYEELLAEADRDP
jgi:soluble lytic murein transglycosylase-like protein